MKSTKLIQSIVASAVIGFSSSSVMAGDYPVYEGFNKQAMAGEAFTGLPGLGKTLAFANIVNGSPFCDLVEESIIKQAMAAGFAKKDIIILNNQYDAVIGLKNADIILAQQPDVFIEFQFDERANNVISRKFAKAGIPIIAIDVPVPGSPFMGADNFGAAWLGGEVMAAKITSKFGGIDGIDKIALLQFPTGGSATMMRSEGFVPPMEEAFGVDAVNAKLIKTDGGAGGTEAAKLVMDDLLAANPDAETWAATAINHESIAGIIAAFEAAGRWDPEKVVLVGMGAGPLGQEQLRDGQIDGSVAFFPEKYGQWAVAAAVARMMGEPVPPYMYPEHVTITMDNINQFYPE